MAVIKDRQEWDDVLDFWFPEGRSLNVEASAHHAHWSWRMQGDADDEIVARFSDLTREAARTAAGTRHEQYPVVDEDGVLAGILFARDLDAAILENRQDTSAGSLALPPVLVLTPDLTLADAALRLAQAGETRAPVVASLETQRLVGFLSSSDLIRARLHVHEEEGSGPSMADLG